MLKYIVKRILSSVLVLLGVVTITFFIARVIPSNPEVKWAGQRATPEQLEAARVELGLDKSLPEQYVMYLGDLLHGNLGKSLRTHQPVVSELKRYIPATLELVLQAFLLAILIGIPLGIYSAKKKDRLLDHVSRFFSIGAVSLPTFWVALFFQLIFYKTLNLLPIGGRLSVEATIFQTVPDITGLLLVDCLLTGNFALMADAFRHIVLPCVTIALYPIGLVARMTRSALLEILGEDYITAGHSYGLADRKMLWKYALKNSLGTTATDVALSMGYTLTDTFLVEAIFSWPGIGSYISGAVTTLDYPAIIGVTLFGACCYIILNLLALSAIFANFIIPYPQDIADASHIEDKLLPPSREHWMGTDELGRDLFSRVVYGARISLVSALGAVGLSLLIGVPLGAVAGSLGGWMDNAIMRLTDVFLSFPPLLLAIAMVAVLGSNLNNAILAISLSWWPWYTRLIRGQAISVKERKFVQAAETIGTSRIKIIFRHIIPNCISPAIVQASMDIGGVILTVASLSFLGLGAQLPTPEWGLMISMGRTYFPDKWWYCIFPGVAIFITVLCFNLLGDAMREILDPKTRKK